MPSADPAEWMDDYHQMLCDAERVEAANDELSLLHNEELDTAAT